ncbi:class I SAM-dependent methyltransferase [Fusibacter sp. JL216-2]|uniref:class I SAM-dependent methyltransferase n=1 Tax=Fusibacter sp. JL216-2 TaxID=3071453 RepID=UPI003D328279
MEKHEKVYIQLKESGFKGWGGKNYDNRMVGWEKQIQLIKEVVGDDVESIAEFGCGAGDVSIKLAQEGFRVTGIDISPTAIEWAKTKIGEFDLDIEFIASSICSEDLLLNREFDMVIDGNCIHCLFDDDRNRFYYNAKRILKSGGYLFMSSAIKENDEDETPSISSIERCVITEEALRDELDTMGFEKVKDWISHENHRHYYGLYTLLKD